jgi:hypothetical protein
MNERKSKLDRVEQALWQAPPPAPPPPAQPIEVWQANVMRAVRLATPEAEAALLDLSWLRLQRAAISAVVVAAVGWLVVLVWAPLRDSDLARAAWRQSVAETWNLE